MKFLIYTILSDSNSDKIQRFLNQTRIIRLPIEIHVFDTRKEKYDSIRKILKNERSFQNLFISKSKDSFDAHAEALFASKCNSFGATAFIDLEVNFLDEFDLGYLILNTLDKGAVCPIIASSNQGVGFNECISTKSDIFQVWNTDIINSKEKIIMPSDVFAYSKEVATKCVYKDHSLGEDHELYRFFVKNNVKFSLLPNVIFKV